MRRLIVLLLVAGIVSACGTAPEGGGDSGVFGRVLLGPQCPVVSEESPCPDAPVQATIRVETTDGEVVTSFESGADGRFRVSLDPGSYMLIPEVEAGVRFAKPVDVTVPTGRFVRADIFIDTGIR